MALALILATAATAISANGDGAFMSSEFVKALLAGLAALGLGGGGYLAGRAKKVAIEPTPVPVRAEPTVCDERHDMITHQMEDIFARLRKLEAADAAQSAKLEAIDKRIESMDFKLDRIIGKLG